MKALLPHSSAANGSLLNSSVCILKDLSHVFCKRLVFRTIKHISASWRNSTVQVMATELDDAGTI
jgi:hypothetical protein